MSRSKWASWETSRASVGAIASADVGSAEFVDRAHPERRQPQARISSAKHVITLIIASSLVLAAAPAMAHAGSVRTSHAVKASSRDEHRSAQQARGPSIVLTLGSGYSNRGIATRVRTLQRRLAGAGFAPGPIDGLFGPLTRAAVTRFQAARGLAPDGIAGPLTLTALRHAPVVLYPGLGAVGHGSSRVRGLQRRLAKAGYPPGPIDGRYGPRTARAVAQYQASRGLPVDGIAGPRTLANLRTHTPAGPRPTGPHTRKRRPHHGSTRGTKPRPSRHPAHKQPSRAPTPRPVAPASNPSSSPSTGFILLLIALAAALGLGAIWLARRRRTRSEAGIAPERHDAAPAPQARTAAPAPAPPGDAAPAATRQDEPAPTPTQPDRPAPIPTRSDEPAPIPTQADEPGPTPGQPDVAERLYQQALAFEQEGDDARAIEGYRHADRLGHVGAAFNLGFLLEAQGELVGAAEAYDRADKLGHPAAASNLGVLLEQRGDRTGAMAAFVRAVRRNDAVGAFNLAVLLEEQSDHVGALRMYDRAVRLGDEATAERAEAAAQELRERIAEDAGVPERGGRGGS